jgi:hypothetical protein
MAIYRVAGDNNCAVASRSAPLGKAPIFAFFLPISRSLCFLE